MTPIFEFKVCEFWDDPSPKATLTGGLDLVNDLLEIQQGKLVSCSLDGQMKIWDVVHQTCEKTIPDLRLPHSMARLGSHTILYGGERGLSLWDTRIDKSITLLKNDLVIGFAVCKRGRTVALNTPMEIKQFDLRRSAMSVKSIVMTKGLPTVFKSLNENELTVGFFRGRVAVYETSNRRLTASIQITDKKIVDCTKAADGSTLVATSSTVTVWDGADEPCDDLLEIAGEIRTIAQVAGSKFVVGDSTGYLTIGDMSSHVDQVCFSAHAAAVTKVIPLSGRQVASCSEDKTIKIWDLQIFE